ncbi:hypothetical protein BURMUCF1_0869, partial [Burkholderia multivorans ATCC BAA-247]
MQTEAPADARTAPAPHIGRLRTADGLELASYRW